MFKNFQHHIKKRSLLKILTFGRQLISSSPSACFGKETARDLLDKENLNKTGSCFSWLNFGSSMARKRNVIIFSSVVRQSSPFFLSLRGLCFPEGATAPSAMAGVRSPNPEGAAFTRRGGSVSPTKRAASLQAKLLIARDALSLQKSESLEETIFQKPFSPNSKKDSLASRRLQVNYTLENFQRSNQDTCLTHKPAVFEGNWVQSGDLLTDCASSVGGELSLGQNLLIAYMPWEGYNFEDAILISERLVMDDLYTSVHIERYELQVHKTKLGVEEITQKIPDISQKEIKNLDSFGIVKLGTWVEEGDLLVGKITPINKKKISPYQKLLYTILEKQVKPFKDSSLRAPRGIKAKVIDIKYFFQSAKNPLLLSTFSPERRTSTSFKGNSESLAAPIQRRSPPSQRERIRATSLRAELLTAAPSGVKGIGESSGPVGTGSILRMGLELRSRPFQRKEGWQPEDSQLLIPFPASTIHENKLFQKSLLLSKKVRSRKDLLGMTTPFLPPDKKNTAAFLPIRKKTKISLSFTQPKATASKGNMSLGSSSGKALSSREGLLRSVPLGRFFSKGVSRESLISDSLAAKGREMQPISGRSQSYVNRLEVSEQNSNKVFLKLKHKLGKVSTIHIYLAEKRKIQVGDKMAGRHGNKGIVSQILPIQDMPYLPDGSPIDMVLNPLGVPSRMNVGQIYECLLGLAGKYLGEQFKVFAFDEMYGSEASRSFVFNKLYEARKKTGLKWLFDPNSPGKMRLYDGRNGECFHQKVTVGQAYMLRLVHMVDDKMHARSTGPYSLVTQQPLRGRSKQGGQRLGEMEVWALEGYGAAFTLLEMLTIKSDDMTGRMTLWSNLILNKEIAIGTPESFKVLVCELQALCLDIGLYRLKNTQQKESNNMKSSLHAEQGINYKTSLKEIDRLINLP